MLGSRATTTRRIVGSPPDLTQSASGLMVTDLAAAQPRTAPTSQLPSGILVRTEFLSPSARQGTFAALSSVHILCNTGFRMSRRPWEGRNAVGSHAPTPDQLAEHGRP